MFDVNPLGPMMHLRQLERQAIAQRERGESRSKIMVLGERLAVALHRIFTNRSATRTSKPLLR